MTAATFSLARDSLQAHEPIQRLGRFRRRGYQRMVWLRGKGWVRVSCISSCMVGAGVMTSTVCICSR